MRSSPVLHSEFLRKNARRYIQAASLAGARRSGTFPLPEGLAPQTIGCYRLGFVVLCTDK